MSISTPNAATKVTFGLPSLLKPTPLLAKNISTGVLYTAFMANLVIQFFPQVPATVKTAIGTYSMEVVGFVHAICNTFGITVTGPTSALPNKQL